MPSAVSPSSGSVPGPHSWGGCEMASPVPLETPLSMAKLARQLSFRPASLAMSEDRAHISSPTRLRGSLHGLNDTTEFLTSPGPLASMLKTTTETGDIGIFSIQPITSSTSYDQLTKPSFTASDAQSSLRTLGPDVSRSFDSGNFRPALQDTTSEIVSMYGSESQKSYSSSLPPPLEDLAHRSYSLTTPGARTLYSTKSSSTLPSLPAGCYLQRPRSPFPYPTRLKRPGVRPTSPALTENGSIDYSRIVEIDHVSSRTVHGSYKPIYPDLPRSPAPLSMRFDYYRPRPRPSARHPHPSHRIGAAAAGRSGSAYGATGLRMSRSVQSHSSHFRREGEQGITSSSLTSFVDLYKRPISRTASSTAHYSAGALYYDYTEQFEDQNLPYHPSGALEGQNRAAESDQDRRSPSLSHAQVSRAEKAIPDLSLSHLGIWMYPEIYDDESGEKDSKTPHHDMESDPGDLCVLRDLTGNERISTKADTYQLFRTRSSHQSCADGNLQHGESGDRLDPQCLAQVDSTHTVIEDVVSQPGDISPTQTLGDCRPDLESAESEDETYSISEPPEAAKLAPDSESTNNNVCSLLPISCGKESPVISDPEEVPKSPDKERMLVPSGRLLRYSAHHSLDPSLGDLAAFVTSFENLNRASFRKADTFERAARPVEPAPTLEDTDPEESGATVQTEEKESSQPDFDEADIFAKVPFRRHRRTPAALHINTTAVEVSQIDVPLSASSADTPILSPEPISPVRHLRVKNSIPQLMKALPSLPALRISRASQVPVSVPGVKGNMRTDREENSLQFERSGQLFEGSPAGLDEGGGVGMPRSRVRLRVRDIDDRYGDQTMVRPHYSFEKATSIPEASIEGLTNARLQRSESSISSKPKLKLRISRLRQDQMSESDEGTVRRHPGLKQCNSLADLTREHRRDLFSRPTKLQGMFIVPDKGPNTTLSPGQDETGRPELLEPLRQSRAVTTVESTRDLLRESSPTKKRISEEIWADEVVRDGVTIPSRKRWGLGKKLSSWVLRPERISTLGPSARAVESIPNADRSETRREDAHSENAPMMKARSDDEDERNIVGHRMRRWARGAKHIVKLCMKRTRGNAEPSQTVGS